jgi:hypothetical protein
MAQEDKRDLPGNRWRVVMENPRPPPHNVHIIEGRHRMAILAVICPEILPG